MVTLTKVEFERIISEIEVPFNWDLLLRYDDKRPYLQVEDKHGVDNFTGGPLPWRGRKWLLSPHMCISEVVRTAYKAIVTAVEHEVNEQFLYKGEAVFDPHRNIDLLVEIAGRKNAIDSRDNRTGDLT